MNFNKLNNELNKNVEEETSFINSVSLIKYFLIFIPIYFIFFSVFRIVFLGLSEYNWKYVLLEAVLFAVLWRVFHYVMKIWNTSWKK